MSPLIPSLSGVAETFLECIIYWYKSLNILQECGNVISLLLFTVKSNWCNKSSQAWNFLQKKWIEILCRVFANIFIILTKTRMKLFWKDTLWKNLFPIFDVKWMGMLIVNTFEFLRSMPFPKIYVAHLSLIRYLFWVLTNFMLNTYRKHKVINILFLSWTQEEHNLCKVQYTKLEVYIMNKGSKCNFQYWRKLPRMFGYWYRT